MRNVHIPSKYIHDSGNNGKYQARQQQNWLLSLVLIKLERTKNMVAIERSTEGDEERYVDGGKADYEMESKTGGRTR